MNSVENNKRSKEKKKDALVWVISCFLSILGEISGVLFFSKSELNQTWTMIAEISVMLFVCLLIPINFLLKKQNVKKIEGMNAAELQSFYLSHRENAEETTLKQLKSLKKIRLYTAFYSVFLTAAAIFISVFSYLPDRSWISIPTMIFSLLIYHEVLLRLIKPFSKKDFDEDDLYVSESEFPHLYAMAKKARDEIGCKGDIKIALITDGNAGIAQIDGVYSIQLGTIMLSTINEEELFCILLHEFSHIIWENKYCAKETKHYWKITHLAESNIKATPFKPLYLFADLIYFQNYELFRYASSLIIEETADKAMCIQADGKIAASALIKLKYFEFFTWEEGTTDKISPFASKNPNKAFITSVCNEFKEAIKTNEDKWNSLIDLEILSRSASHPTTKMRLDALGATKTETVESFNSEEYIAETKKALSYTDELYWKYNEEYFKERHKEYLDAKERVDKWEAEGKKIVAEEYAGIVHNLRTLGRASDAISVCDRAIEELSNSAAAYAFYMKGNFLIHQYDSLGIEYIYKSMDNHNYIDEGLEMIGHFCCMTGRQKELDEYREKAIIMAQDQMDKYSKLSELKKDDNLSTEKLPEGMLEKILEYVSSIENGRIEKIYLVKKNITEDFSASVFVVKFFTAKNNSDEKKDFEIMNKTFNHLDACYEHQFCLYDFKDVSYIKFESIPESCVYSAQKA